MAELDSQSKTLQSIYGWFAQDRLHVNRRYQRKLVWTLAEKQKLVSSVLNGYPVPAVLLAERDNGYEIIDGLQRLYTLNSFMETSFPMADGRYFRVSEFPTAKNRRDAGVFDPLPENAPEIDAVEVARFLDYPLSVSIMRGASEEDIDEVFSRINTYGHRLSDQERRQAGVQGDFSELVRHLASELRGDASPDMLTLADMPQISIDLPKMRHGYAVQADQVFWVEQGVLSAGDLRDSLDEQCIADIVASIVGGQILERSKDALDKVYNAKDSEAVRITTALDSYGADRLADEFKYCVQEIIRATQLAPKTDLNELVGVKNAFPSVFAIIMIALHEALIGGRRQIANLAGVRAAFRGLYARLNTSRSSTVPSERRKNVDTIKGLIADYLVDGLPESVYSNASVIDVDALIRRSEIETSRYELKQGVWDLGPSRQRRTETYTRVIETISAIANCGPEADGVVLVGVADKESDAERVKVLDCTTPRRVGNRFVVGVAREAALGNESAETYVGRWKTAVRESELSEPLRSDVLASIDYNDYFGLGVLVIRVPRQTGVSYVGSSLFTREADETVQVTAAPKVAGIVARFLSR